MTKSHKTQHDAARVLDTWTAGTLDEVQQLAGQLRAAVQAIERTAPGDRRPIDLTADGHGVYISRRQARTMLRAVAPAALVTGSTRIASTALQSSLAQFVAGLVAMGRRDNTITGDAIAAGLHLRDALTDWIDAARWQQATTRAHRAWPDPARDDGVVVRPVLRQSTPRPAEQSGKRPHQTTLLLPITGKKAHAAGATTNAETPCEQPVARHARRRR